jgi:hypothetical protein
MPNVRLYPDSRLRGAESGSVQVTLYPDSRLRSTKVWVVVSVGATNGTLNVTLGTLVLSATGQVAISGSLAKTLGELALSAAGTVTIAGVLDVVLGELVLTAQGLVVEVPVGLPLGGSRRKPPMAGEPHRVLRQRTEEEEEQLRLLKLLNQANDAKSLKRWQAEENENARQKHNKLLFGRLGREADTKKIRGAPDVKRANREIAKRDDEAERQRQERIYNQRLANLEKGRKKH